MPSLWHPFVCCVFYYYYCQEAIRRSNLHCISWLYNVPEDKRLWIGLLSWTYADWQGRAEKIREKLTPNTDEVCEIWKRYFIKLCWGAHDLQLLFYTELMGRLSRFQGKPRRGHTKLNGLQSKISLEARARLFPSRPHSHLLSSAQPPPTMGGKPILPLHKSSPFPWILRGICPNPLLNSRVFQIALRCWRGDRFTWLGAHLPRPDIASILHYCGSLPSAAILCSHAYIFPLDRPKKFLQGKG